MTAEFLLFIGLSIVAIGAAVGMLMSRNAIYSALFLVINFGTIAVLFLILDAAFIAMVQIAIYAGAIMVLFLFVIMLLGLEQVETGPGLPWQLPAAIALGVTLIAQFLAVLFILPSGASVEISGVAEAFGSPKSVGTLLFTQYLIPFEVTSLLLLAAMVGAIVLTRWERSG